MDIKVAFFDVDGTIVDNHSKKNQSSDMELVPASAVEAIRLLKENGITPFIATGRSPFIITYDYLLYQMTYEHAILSILQLIAP